MKKHKPLPKNSENSRFKRSHEDYTMNQIDKYYLKLTEKFKEKPKERNNAKLSSFTEDMI